MRNPKRFTSTGFSKHHVGRKTDLDHVSAHFSRFRVIEIALSEAALGQFDDRPLLTAAELLADANVDVIAWNGTSAGWLGFERDVQLCDRIQSAMGVPATTSVLALNELFWQQQINCFGLVTPYTCWRPTLVS